MRYFIFRRYVVAIARFKSPEMKGWPSLDATIILVAEILLMGAFLGMNAADSIAMGRELHHYSEAVVDGSAFPISQYLVGSLNGMSDAGIVMFERGCWWFHIVGVLAFWFTYRIPSTFTFSLHFQHILFQP